MLSDDDSDYSDQSDIHQLTINEHYAKAFEYRKEREELAKLKEKYGSDFEEEAPEEDSESDESEDEYGEELTPAVDAALLRTLAKIRRKDPEIYDSNIKVFSEESKKTQGKAPTLNRPAKDKSRPLTIKQQNLAALLESSSRPTSPTPTPLTHAQEQEALRDETISAFRNAVEDEDEDEGGLLTLREGVRDEAELREEEYKDFLNREVGEDLSGLMWVEKGDTKVEENGAQELGVASGISRSEGKKKGRRKERKEETDQEFLMNYILNRGWIDKSERRLPTYREIVGESKPEAEDQVNGATEGDDGNGLDEDEFDEIADRFESTYNFRFEEPDAHIIATHPRSVPTVRRVDTSRKEAREKKKARKAEKMLAKREEVKRLKALKMREAKEKLEQIRAEGGLGKSKVDKGKKKAEVEDENEDWGNEDWGALGELDLDGEWDPEKHDAQMRALYGEGGEYEDDGEKPTWADDIDISDLVPSISEPAADTSTKAGKKKKKKRKHDDDEVDDAGVDPDEMDADVERPEVLEDEEEWDGTEEMRKRVLDKYMDEVYDLDFNDMVGDMPTHFRYAKVEPSTHGLTPVEILMATDAELNSYVGLKRLAPYRKEKFDPRRPEKLKDFRKTLADRGVNGWDPSNDGEAKTKKRKGKKERQKEKAKAAMDEAIKQEAAVRVETSTEAEPAKKKRKRKHGGAVAPS
ncbi:Kri1 family protein [Ceratobasidium sp. AG-Ba]|nr:Kri1 family protein [Ceratobasidium sp. AG-Ba]